MYEVAGILGDRVIIAWREDDEEKASLEARKLLKDPTFEGDSVRVLSVDGEVVLEESLHD